MRHLLRVHEKGKGIFIGPDLAHHPNSGQEDLNGGDFSRKLLGFKSFIDTIMTTVRHNICRASFPPHVSPRSCDIQVPDLLDLLVKLLVRLLGLGPSGVPPQELVTREDLHGSRASLSPWPLGIARAAAGRTPCPRSSGPPSPRKRARKSCARPPASRALRC